MRVAWFVALGLAVGPAVAAGAEEEIPLAWARYLVEGPLERVELTGTRGATVLDLDLLAGERLELEVPLAHVRAAGPPGSAVRGVPEAASAVRFLGWSDRPAPRIPAHLQARPRPPWRPAPPRVPAPLALALVALGPVTFALRRRPFLLAAVGVLATALAVRVQADAAPEPAGARRALEGTRPGARWLAVDVARSLVLAPDAPFALAVEPPGALVELRVTIEEGSPRSVAVVDRGALVRRATFDPGLRLIAPGLNTWGPFAAVWTRPARGSDWRAHGAWELGEALAPGRAGRPPGWLAAGAAQGRGVLVARLGRGAWGGRGDRDGGRDAPESGGEAQGETWLRLAGFGE